MFDQVITLIACISDPIFALSAIKHRHTWYCSDALCNVALCQNGMCVPAHCFYEHIPELICRVQVNENNRPLNKKHSMSKAA